MRLKTLIASTITIAILLVVGMALASSLSRQRLETYSTLQEHAQSCAREVSGLLVLTHEFALHGEARAARQWFTRHQRLLDKLGPGLPAQASAPDGARQLAGSIGRFFRQLVDLQDNDGKGLEQRRAQVLLDQLLMDAQLLADIMHDWNRAVSQQRETVERNFQMLAGAIPLLSLIVLFAIAGVFIWRVMIPLGRLHRAVLAASQGDLNARTATRSKDEIGELSRAFDSMALDMVTRLKQDIVEQEKLEGQLRESRDELQNRVDRQTARLRAIVDTAADGIVTINDRGIIDSFNAAAERIFQYSADEVMGRNVKMLMPSPYHEAHDGYLRDYRATGEARVIGAGREVEGRRKDGTTFPLYLAVSEMNVAGEQRYTGIVRDITAQKRAEQELARLSRIASQTTNGVVITDPQGRVEWINEGFERITGYSLQEMKGRRPGEVLQGPGTDSATVERMRAALRRREAFEVDLINYTRSGEEYWIRINCNPLRDARGDIEGFMAIESDITQRKRDAQRIAESEHRLREAQALAHVGNWQADLTTGELFWSDEIYRIFGHAPQSFAPSVQAFHAAVHPEDLPRVHASEKRAEQTGQHEVVHRIVRPDGAIRHVHELARAEYDSHGNLTRLLGTVQDITADIEAQNALIAARDQAERASQAKSEFLSRMSHELRTPLNAILGFGQILEHDPDLSPDARDSVGEILSAGQHLLELINEVLDLAKVESGGMELSMEVLELEPVLGECLQLMRPQAERHHVQLAQQRSCNARVHADRRRLKQAIINLLSNALKYNRAGGKVTLDAGTSDDGQVRIAVTDTGPGIAPERLRELFQPFNRLDAENSGVEGTGIGLTLTRRMVELMHGRLEVDSEVGAGSTFTIEMPVQDRDADSEPQDQSAPAFEANPAAALPSDRVHTVLYVEDNVANTRLVEQIVNRQPQLNLVCVDSAEQGLDHARAAPPALILLDINLPGMNGYQMLEACRGDARLSHIPVVALSANAMPEDIERARKAGFADYLTKPLDIEKFYTLINEWLDVPVSYN